MARNVPPETLLDSDGDDIKPRGLIEDGQHGPNRYGYAAAQVLGAIAATGTEQDFRTAVEGVSPTFLEGVMVAARDCRGPITSYWDLIVHPLDTWTQARGVTGYCTGGFVRSIEAGAFKSQTQGLFPPANRKEFDLSGL